MESTKVITFSLGCFTGVLLTILGIIGFFFFTFKRPNPPKRYYYMIQANLQRVEFDGETEQDSILYLLQINVRDTSAFRNVKLKTDCSQIKGVTISDADANDVKGVFNNVQKINRRRFSFCHLKSPLLNKYYYIDFATDTLKNLFSVDADYNIYEPEYYLFYYPKNKPLPQTINVKFKNGTLSSKVNNHPLKCYIMGIEYKEPPIKYPHKNKEQ